MHPHIRIYFFENSGTSFESKFGWNKTKMKSCPSRDSPLHHTLHSNAFIHLKKIDIIHTVYGWSFLIYCVAFEALQNWLKLTFFTTNVEKIKSFLSKTVTSLGWQKNTNVRQNVRQTLVFFCFCLAGRKDSSSECWKKIPFF